MDIKALSITELKALGYDQMQLLNQTQRNLAMIEQELLTRVDTPTQSKKGK